MRLAPPGGGKILNPAFSFADVDTYVVAMCWPTEYHTLLGRHLACLIAFSSQSLFYYCHVLDTNITPEVEAQLYF